MMRDLTYDCFARPVLSFFKKNRLLVAGVLALAATLGCQKKSHPLPTPEAPKPPETEAPTPPPNQSEWKLYPVARMKKTGCYGSCPVFTVEIFSDGTAHYNGVKNTPRTGRFRATVGKAVLDELTKRGEESGFFALQSSYPADGKKIADFPTTTTFLRVGKKERSVENNFDAPLNLLDFEAYFIELVESLNWTRDQKND